MTVDMRDLKDAIIRRDFMRRVTYLCLSSVLVSLCVWMLLSVKRWLQTGFWGTSYRVCDVLNINCWPVTGLTGLDSLAHFTLAMSAVAAWFWLSVILVVITAFATLALNSDIRFIRNR